MGKMRPKTREIIQKLLTDMETSKGGLREGEIKQATDEYMFCFGNCYTEEETERHMTNKIPSLAPEMISDEESRQAYLREAEECAQLRAAEANRDQGEASTAKD